MKKNILLLLFFVSFIKVFTQQDPCNTIPIIQNNSGWSYTHGSPTWTTNSIWLWAKNNRGEGVNHFNFSFKRNQQYRVRLTATATSLTLGGTQNIPILDNAFMNVILTTNRLIPDGRAIIPPIPTPNQVIMQKNIWNQLPNSDTYELVFTAEQDFNNLWFFPTKQSNWPQANVLITDLEICPITCNADNEVNFHFEDKDAIQQSAFNLCEDVFVNASSTLNIDAYNIELFEVNFNATTLLSRKSTTTGQFNLTELFADTVTFEANTTYEVKISMENTYCNTTIFKTKRFTYNDSFIEGDFELVYNCSDTTFDASVQSLTSNVAHHWKLYETSVAGSILDSDTINLVTEVNDVDSHTFNSLDTEKHYYVAYNASTTNCNASEVRIALTPDCCTLTPKIFPFCDDPCVMDVFPLKVKDQNDQIITSSDGYNFFWTNTTTGDIITNDIVLARSSDVWTLTLKKIDSNCEYELKYSLVCCNDTIQLKNYECPTVNDVDLLSNTKIREQAKTANGCRPCNSGVFVIAIEDELGNAITDFESITWSDGLEENEVIRLGDVNTTYTATVTLRNPDGVSTCTYEDTIIYECSECEIVDAPKNLSNDGTFLSWDPVPNATEYIISVASKPVNCCNEPLLYFSDLSTNTNTIRIPDDLKNGCFAWEVKAVCTDGSISEPSEPSCYSKKDIDCENFPAPINLSTDGTFLSWDAVPHATEYIISVASKPVNCCNEPLLYFSDLRTNTNTIRIPDDLKNGCFAWEVKAVCANGDISEPSEPSCYSKKDIDCENFPAPTNLSNNDTHLLWDPVPHAVEYIVSVASKPVICCDGPESYFSDLRTTTNSIQIPDDIKIGCFAWEVKAVCANGDISKPSEPICYDNEEKDECTTLAPPSNLRNSDTHLLWDPIRDAVTYIVSVATQDVPCCNSTSTLFFNPIETSDSSIPIPNYLKNGCFAWEVKAVCADGSISDPSKPMCYENKETNLCAKLPAPRGLDFGATYLVWDRVPGAVKYVVSSPENVLTQCCGYSAGEKFLATETTTNRLYLTPDLMPACFVWQVVAVCGDGSVSKPSQPKCFRGIIAIEDPINDIMMRTNTLDNTSIQEHDEIMIFPNPSNGNISIRLEDTATKTALSIFNTNGVFVKKIENIHDLEHNATTFYLNLNLPKGIYFLKFETQIKSITKQIIIK
ncbi:T9SS type A sorting domain-containing protein [Tenacibaculum jejuense]|uniref:Secretion system C-terminal sorting domain-containing protein n=1 Tax=Tenacibaculum jejuense TaxID=584609 RepID=A0A238U9R9_9FLAO|nr:T9SS type A sorting domain-containing protein [Tenacibaculum jejuense]SNR15852.1 Protein of unknown function precursor containing a C-terminal secretion signal. Putative adhesin [Tenacibaculum jejuense]